MMRGMRILVVEDEYLVATDLAEHFRSLGAEILGPVPSLRQAAKLVGSADGAVLDIDLNGQSVYPLADMLAARSIPFVFFSGDDRAVVPDRFRFAHRLPKPGDVRKAARWLAEEPSRAIPSALSNVVQMLPKLRLAARLQLGDAYAADRLVERTLKAAIEDTSAARLDLSLADWLNQTMEKVLADEGGLMLN